MRKIILMAAVMLASLATYAQGEIGKIYAKPTVGMTIANLSKSKDGKFKVGLVAGAEFEAPVTKRLSISLGALYSMQGYKMGVTVMSNPDIGEEEVDAAINMDYINVPILLNAYVAKGLAFKIGVQPGILVSAKMKVNTDNLSQSVDQKESFHTFDLSIPIGVSYEYRDFVLDARYNFGVLKTVKNLPNGASWSRNLVIQLSLGYKFAL